MMVFAPSFRRLSAILNPIPRLDPDIMKVLFGDEITKIKYYWLIETQLNGIPLVVSRTGWSSELGYEIYLRDGSRGNELWELIMEAGKKFNLQFHRHQREASNSFRLK